MENSVNRSNNHPNKSLNSKGRVKRGGKFTQSDISLLLELIRENIDIITNQRIDRISCKEKDDAWNNITKKFNEQSKTYRNINMLRKKFDNLKNTFKDKYDFQKNSWKTSSSVSSNDESIKDVMILLITKQNSNSLELDKECVSGDDIEECVSVKSDSLRYEHTTTTSTTSTSTDDNNYENYLALLDSSDDFMYNNEDNFELLQLDHERRMEIVKLKHQCMIKQSELMKTEHALQMQLLKLELEFKNKELERTSSDDFSLSNEDNIELIKEMFEVKFKNMEAIHALKVKLRENKLELAQLNVEHTSELLDLMKK